MCNTHSILLRHGDTNKDNTINAACIILPAVSSFKWLLTVKGSPAQLLPGVFSEIPIKL